MRGEKCEGRNVPLDVRGTKRVGGEKCEGRNVPLDVRGAKCVNTVFLVVGNQI